MNKIDNAIYGNVALDRPSNVPASNLFILNLSQVNTTEFIHGIFVPLDSFAFPLGVYSGFRQYISMANIGPSELDFHRFLIALN